MLNHYVHAYLRALAGSRAHRVGPFLASFDDHDAGLFRNYAVPDDGVDPTPDQVAEHCQVDGAGVFDCLVWVGHTGFVVPRRRRCTGGTATRWRSSVTKLLTGLRYVPRVVVTDKLRSYGAAHREVLPSVEHRQSQYLNNRAENSHQPTRQRERAMKGFRSVGGAQRFLSAFSGISPPFRPRRHRLTAVQYRREMTSRCATWNEVVGLPAAA